MVDGCMYSCLVTTRRTVPPWPSCTVKPTPSALCLLVLACTCSLATGQILRPFIHCARHWIKPARSPAPNATLYRPTAFERSLSLPRSRSLPQTLCLHLEQRRQSLALVIAVRACAGSADRRPDSALHVSHERSVYSFQYAVSGLLTHPSGPPSGTSSMAL